MHKAGFLRQISRRYRVASLLMDERMRRLWAATEARAYGWGGVSAISEATGLSRNTIRKGAAEAKALGKGPQAALSRRVRRPGGGRKRLTESDPGLLKALEALVGPVSRGDHLTTWRRTGRSATHLARELTRQGHPISPSTVASLLRAQAYGLQRHHKTKDTASQ